METKLYVYLLAGIIALTTFAQCDSVTSSEPDANLNSEESVELPELDLISPTDNATNQSTQLELNWDKIKGAKTYNLQLSKSRNFETNLVDTTAEGTSYQTPQLETKTTYYWHVKPYKEDYNGPALKWSETWQFTTSDGEAETVTVDLLTPTDGGQLDTTSPIFDWSSVSESAEYHYQLSGDESFSDVLKDTVSDTSGVQISGLNSGAQYYWRVSPILESATGSWSEVFGFTTSDSATDTTALSAPVQISPKDGATNTSLTPTFAWESVEGADHYILHANRIDPTEMVIETTVNDTTYIPQSDLDPGATHDWRVRAVKDGVNGNWSNIHRFTTTSESSGTATATVTLTSPSDGATGQSTTLTLAWETLSGISNYQVQVATENTFSSPVTDKIVGSTSYDVSGLSNDQTYYWRVQADGDGDTGNWSSIWNFSTQQTTGSQTGQDSRSGDEAALEALYQSTNGSNWNYKQGWSSSGMSLSDDIYGVKVATLDGELRVTEIDLRDNNLTGDIEISSIGNLKEMTLFSVMLNSIQSNIPAEITQCHSLEYLYLSGSDNVVDLKNEHPHEEATTGSGTVHPGKIKGSENNVFSGPIPSTINNLTNLKWFVVNWSDISSIPNELFETTSLVGLQIYENRNIASRSLPASIGTMTNLENLMLGGGSGSDWDENTDGFLTGSWPSEISNLTNLRHLWAHGHADLSGFPDLSGNTNLTSLMLNRTELSGDLPSWLFDGSIPNLNLFNISWAEGSGLSGGLPEFNDTRLTLFNVIGNNLSGSIPASFWNNTKRIKVTDFSYNDLTSIGTTDLTENTQVRNLRWSNNQIGPEKWPNLDWGNLPNLSRVQFDNNHYVFSNMLYVPSGQSKTIFELYKGLGLKRFSYSPQKPFGQSRTVSFSIGSTITLDDFDGVVTHPDNVYQWQKDGTDIPGATNRTLSISNLGSADAGTYRLQVTNPGVPGLTLISQPIKLKN